MSRESDLIEGYPRAVESGILMGKLTLLYSFQDKGLVCL